MRLHQQRRIAGALGLRQALFRKAPSLSVLGANDGYDREPEQDAEQLRLVAQLLAQHACA